MKIGIKKLTIFALSFVMIVFCIFASVFSPNYTLKKSLVNAEEMQEENVIQPRSVIGAIGGAVMVFRCVEYLGKTVKTLNAVADSISAGDSFKDVCNTAIDTFIGRSSADQPTTPGIDYSQKLYEEMTYEIKSINKKIDGLEDDLQDINKSIGDLANVIVTESNKEYINDFRLNYVNLSNDMLREYDQLTASLNKNGTNIDSAKLSYDDLYIAAYALNDMLFEYMTGNYRIDGLSIQDVMYEYISSVESLTATEKNERCIEFTEDLFASYALSQYCL
ncbi:MAG: hypothetical protein IJW13_06315 [Clostridia bacterium]|nr:hypothetical protein [Clostridia bacterium]